MKIDVNIVNRNHSLMLNWKRLFESISWVRPDGDGTEGVQ